MAHDIVSADNALREYLHAQARDFLMLMVSTLLEHSAESGQAAYDQLHGRVDALAAGDEVWISRYELPDDHPQAAPHGGHPCDNLLLDTDNVLRAVTTKHSGAQGF